MEISTKKISHMRLSFETQFKIGKKCLEFPLRVYVKPFLKSVNTSLFM